MGETRRELVMRWARRVRDCTFERRIASLPGGFMHVPVVRRSDANAIDGRRMVVSACS